MKRIRNQMSIVQRALRQGIWFGVFRVIGQSFSWASAIVVARILAPDDYGLFAIALIFAGYLLILNDLGLDRAIVQKEEISDKELSGLFWFMLSFGVFLTGISIISAYPIVVIFSEPKALRIIQLSTIMFIVNSFLVIPRAILERALKFKTLGSIEAASTITSCTLMVILAKLGWGVWTLVAGYIVLKLTAAILCFSAISWRPRFHFNLSEIKSYLKFGAHIVGSASLHYIHIRSDRFFGGMALGASSLGFYSLAYSLSAAPLDKLLFLLNRVSLPVFSRYQKKHYAFNKFYLKFTDLTASVAFPIYVGGIFLADQLIPVLLGVKWTPLIFPFKLLCASQLIMSITIPNLTANIAQGRPHWGLYWNILNVLFMPFSFYLAARYGLNALAIPWITVSPLLRFVLVWITIKKLGISLQSYLKNIFHPIFATAIMLFSACLIKHFYGLSSLALHAKIYILLIALSCIIVYGIYITIFRRKHLMSLLRQLT